MSEEQRSDYHAGMIAALKTKYDDQFDFMETIKEKILGEKPPRLDAVILKKASNRHLADEIGCFFQEHNVIEFKGFGDGININSIYRIQAYALFYMTIDRHIGEIPIENVTITVVQYRFPRNVFQLLSEKGCKIMERSTGIWELSGKLLLFPFQVIDAKQLSNAWSVLKILAPGASETQIEQIWVDYENAGNPILQDHLADVLRTSFDYNEEVFMKLKEEGKMSEAISRVFDKEIQQKIALREEQLVSSMLQNHETADKIILYSGWSPERIMEFAKKNGITSLAI